MLRAAALIARMAISSFTLRNSFLMTAKTCFADSRLISLTALPRAMAATKRSL